MFQISIVVVVCVILDKDNVPGAQTGRSGVVPAGEGCAWRRSLTGRSSLVLVVLGRQPSCHLGGVITFAGLVPDAAELASVSSSKTNSAIAAIRVTPGTAFFSASGSRAEASSPLPAVGRSSGTHMDLDLDGQADGCPEAAVHLDQHLQHLPPSLSRGLAPQARRPQHLPDGRHPPGRRPSRLRKQPWRSAGDDQRGM